MSRRFLSILSVLFALSFAPFALAGTYQSSYGYTLNLPDDWKQIPDSALKMTMSTVLKPNPQNPFVLDAGFQPAANPGWMEYPYLLVQVCPYSKMGHTQLNEDEFPEVIKAISGADVKKEAGKVLNDKINNMLSDANMGQPLLDSANRRFTMMTSMTVQGFGQVKGLMVGHFGKESLVQMCYFDKASHWDQGVSSGRAVLDSFSFDPAHTYSVEFANAHPSRGSASGVMNKGLQGAVIGGAVGLVLYLLGIGRKKA